MSGKENSGPLSFPDRRVGLAKLDISYKFRGLKY